MEWFISNARSTLYCWVKSLHTYICRSCYVHMYIRRSCYVHMYICMIRTYIHPYGNLTARWGSQVSLDNRWPADMDNKQPFFAGGRTVAVAKIKQKSIRNVIRSPNLREHAVITCTTFLTVGYYQYPKRNTEEKQRTSTPDAVTTQRYTREKPAR